MTSNDSIHTPTQDTINKLKDKHPQRHPNSMILPEPFEDCDNVFRTNRDNLFKAMHYFKKGNARGPDGLVPQHLIDMTGDTLGEPGNTVFSPLRPVL